MQCVKYVIQQDDYKNSIVMAAFTKVEQTHSAPKYKMPVKTNRVEKITFKFEVRPNLKITSSKLKTELIMILILAETSESKRKNHTFGQDEDNTWGGEVRGKCRLQEHRGGHQHSEQHDRRQSNGAGAD